MSRYGQGLQTLLPSCSPHLPTALRVPRGRGWPQLPSARSLDPPHSSQPRASPDGSRARPSSPGQGLPTGWLCSGGSAEARGSSPASSLTQSFSRTPCPSPFTSVPPISLASAPLMGQWHRWARASAETQLSLLMRPQWQRGTGSARDAIGAERRPFLSPARPPTPGGADSVGGKAAARGWVSLQSH